MVKIYCSLFGTTWWHIWQAVWISKALSYNRHWDRHSPVHSNLRCTLCPDTSLSEPALTAFSMIYAKVALLWDPTTQPCLCLSRWTLGAHNLVTGFIVCRYLDHFCFVPITADQERRTTRAVLDMLWPSCLAITICLLSKSLRPKCLPILPAPNISTSRKKRLTTYYIPSTDSSYCKKLMNVIHLSVVMML